MPDSLSWLIKEDLLVVAIDLPAVALISAENCTKHFGSPGADQSSKAHENFASTAKRKIYRGYCRESAGLALALPLVRARALSCPPDTAGDLQFMSDHQMHYLRWVRRRDGKRRDPPAVTQDCDGVTKIKDLIQMMGYKDYRHTEARTSRIISKRRLDLS